MKHSVIRPMITGLLLVAGGYLCDPTATAQETTAAGLHDLVIMDPGAHEYGLPAVNLRQLPGGQKIDIPPTVHVHRYFYSGDKVYQAPIIQGGPTVVVASHPRTGARMYIDVVLPAGAPRIAYTQDSITYVYSDRRVEVKFRHFPFDPNLAIVKHHSGKGLPRYLGDTHEHVREHMRDGMANSQVVTSVKEVAAGGGELLSGVRASVGAVSARGVDTLKQLSSMVPGVVYLKSKADQQPQSAYESTIRHAELKRDHAEVPFVRTNR
ncbi:hypothetical protein [Rhodopirellula bahusiensis]|uniref:hypothetical protein n=1 Tax=Rhodopirellula bahusiensis TaxID=2014065 RepID=UPI003265BBF7